MRYKLLGKSGLRVSELCLGTMTFGDVWQDWGLDTSKDESRKIFDGFAEAGGNFIDTANKYNEGQSESLLGEFIESDRDRFVVATKYTLSTREGDPNACGNHRKNMARALEASLKRLKTDYLDLYWLHAWDLRHRSKKSCVALMTWFAQARCFMWASPIRRRGLWRRPTRSPNSTAGARLLVYR